MVMRHWQYSYIGNGIAPFKNKKTTNAVPIIENGRILIPLDYYYYWYSENEKQLWLDKKYRLLLFAHVKKIEGELYVPLKTIEEARGNHVFYDSGLIVISKTKILDSIEDKICIDAFKKDFEKWKDDYLQIIK